MRVKEFAPVFYDRVRHLDARGRIALRLHTGHDCFLAEVDEVSGQVFLEAVLPFDAQDPYADDPVTHDWRRRSGPVSRLRTLPEVLRLDSQGRLNLRPISTHPTFEVRSDGTNLVLTPVS